MIRLDISLIEPICDAPMKQIASELRLRVATIEDIVAEKLRALLQQPIRNRQRRQDLLDIAVIMSRQPGFDRRLVSRFMLEKAAARDVIVTRLAFHHDEVIRRARIGYDELKITTRVSFIDFNDALAALFKLVDDLQIPQEPS
ncbi:MAG: nucleotidyl transferase AbiEii/AbiGii toxin family protein [Chloroflexota bacterium]|nr:nucleotidyl transferase AbiEii/AbiGii toxin family protein [Chloroflexota bacterium]